MTSASVNMNWHRVTKRVVLNVFLLLTPFSFLGFISSLLGGEGDLREMFYSKGSGGQKMVFSTLKTT